MADRVPVSKYLNVRVDEELYRQITEAAARDERHLSEWVRVQLRRAAAIALGGATALLLLHLPHGHAWGFWRHHAGSGPCAVQPGGKPPPPMCYGGFPPPSGGLA